MTIIWRDTFERGDDGYSPRQYLLSAYSIECATSRRVFHIEAFDLTVGCVAETRTFTNPTVAEGFIVGWLPNGQAIPNLLEAERRAMRDSRGSTGKRGAA